MPPIIAQRGRPGHREPGPHPDALARQRRDRLARATAEDMESALAFLGMIDPEAFEIALTAVAPRGGKTPVTLEISGDAEDVVIPGDAVIPEDEEPLPVCRHCGAPVGIFPDRGLRWQHFRGDGATSGTQEIYDPGHLPEVGWLLPGEDPEDF
jgi:hypothetical protein